jgi:chromosome segregation ATPase
MFRTLSIAGAFALSAVASSAVAQQAQTAPPKSKAQAPSIVLPASPAPRTTTKTLSGKSATGGKVLTLEELRSCMKRMDDVAAGHKDLQQRRAALDAEKDEVVNGGEALKAMKADVEAKLAAVREWQQRMRAHGGEIEAFNQRVKALEEAPARERDALSRALEADRERLNKMRTSLVEEESRLVPPYESSVRAYNERALARDARVSDWNARNKALNESSTQLEIDRAEWASACANRPYREDDEIAIKAGK